MNKIKLVAIDLAKRCYQVGAIDEHGKMLYNRKLSPAKFALAMQQLEPTIVAMEACAAAHYWGRRLIALGHEVRLVPPQHAKAFRRVHKSDAHDTLSIAEAAQRPNIHFVPVKSIAQQDLQLLGRIRERLIAQRTALINQVRGLAREYGVNFAKTRQALAQQLPEALADASNEFTPIAREALAQLLNRSAIAMNSMISSCSASPRLLLRILPTNGCVPYRVSVRPSRRRCSRASVTPSSSLTREVAPPGRAWYLANTAPVGDPARQHHQEW